MRQIRFRGLSEGKWYYGLLTFMFSSYAIVDPKDENTVHLVDVKTVGQFTGLKDKNGVEIYEGDVLSEHPGGIHFDEEDYRLVVVKKTEYGWSPHVDVIGHKAHDYKGNLFEYIIVGNIYENPELLEEITK